MIKRTVIIGQYDTAAAGWTLSALQLSAPKQKTKYVDKTGGDGSWDWSTVMTDGVPRYEDRTLTITLEHSESNRLEREGELREIINLLDGFEWEITLPDTPNYYLVGRTHVGVNYNDLVHCSITISAQVRPWLYKKQEKVILLTAISTEKNAILVNAGRLTLVPTLEVEGGTVSVTYGTSSINLSAGKY